MPVAMNLQFTLPFAAAMQVGAFGGLPSTLNEPLSAGMLVVAVDVVAVEDVVVVAGVLVVVVVAATEVVVTGVGDVSPPPQPVAARTIAAISAARPCACDANLRGLDGAIILPSRSNRLVKQTYCKGPRWENPWRGYCNKRKGS